jgi:hypothetical protein
MTIRKVTKNIGYFKFINLRHLRVMFNLFFTIHIEDVHLIAFYKSLYRLFSN